MIEEGNHILVKWNDPTQELIGCVRLADNLVVRQVALPKHIAFAVPNATWAREVKRACKALGVRDMPIMDIHDIRGDFDQVFMVACVDGLIPGPAAFDDSDPRSRSEAMERDRAAFTASCDAARRRTFLSCFTRMDESMAKSIHARYTRTKMEGGRRMAMVRPSLFIEEEGMERPTTLGGQALLRRYGLN
jgi:hypothetical protein